MSNEPLNCVCSTDLIAVFVYDAGDLFLFAIGCTGNSGIFFVCYGFATSQFVQEIDISGMLRFRSTAYYPYTRWFFYFRFFIVFLNIFPVRFNK